VGDEVELVLACRGTGTGTWDDGAERVVTIEVTVDSESLESVRIR